MAKVITRLSSTNIHLSGLKTVTQQRLPPHYWENQENIDKFLSKIKEKYNLNTVEDWNSITKKHISTNGGSSLVNKYSMFEIKCMACPEGKSIFNNPPQPAGYWEDKNNVHNFLSEIKEKFNINTIEDWNSITKKFIQSNGGKTLLNKYSIYDLKCMAFPEGKLFFKNPKHVAGYWENNENILQFLSELGVKYNLKTPENWNSITRDLIKSNGGSSLLSKYSLLELKCMACPEGEGLFDNQPKPSGYWENEENIHNFLSEIKEKYKLNTPEDWNSITKKLIASNGGNTLLNKYSIFKLKCMACPEGKEVFKNISGYWESKDNILQFLSNLKEKYNLNTPEDWNSITKNHILSNGGSTLLKKYTMFEIKCMACPEGKSIFTNPKQPAGYWENSKNIKNFLAKLKEKYNLCTIEDWNSVTRKHIIDNGGRVLLDKYSIYELKCMACPEGKLAFNNPHQASAYWENDENVRSFISKIKEKYNLKTPEDWKRISRPQITAAGGSGLLISPNYSQIKIKFETSNEKSEFVPLSKLIVGSIRKRSSQRWLFLQVQKLFPQEEIVEDYFHSELSRISGANVQFDIFMIERNIAIEYHGKQHYEDIPQAFSTVETYKQRDEEKEKLCSEHGIQLIVIPYWWDNKLDSLRTFLYSKINF